MSQVYNEEDAASVRKPAADNKEQWDASEEVQKPDVSYIEMIARAILDSPTKKLCLQDIYESIEKNYPYFRTAHPGWRNSVRHNLSLHECFYKGERCENGKGHYWYVHPLNLEDFQRGDFRRRLVKERVRRMQSLCHPYAPELYCSYAPLRYLVAATSAPSPTATLPLPCATTYYPAVTHSPVHAAITEGLTLRPVAAPFPLCIPTQPLFNTSPGAGASTCMGAQQQTVKTTGVRPSQSLLNTSPARTSTSPPGFLFTMKNILSTQ